MGVSLCAVSVDLDEIPNYFAIHGLAEPEGPASTLVYDVAIDRLLALAKELTIPLTLFAVGSDLSRPASAAKLRAAREAGCEIGNHTLDHRYDLVRLGRDEIRRQIHEGSRAIERATGAPPVGFRAPGYTITDEVFSVLEELGTLYDSSVFPCPPYWAAKVAGLGLIALRGRTSRSIVDTPAVLTAPTRPYRIGRPYWRRGEGLVELPVQVTRGPRLPFFGTSVTLGGPRLARYLARACAGEPLVNLELHGIDVLDASDGLETLRPHQPDVRVPRARKVDALRAALEELRAAGHAFVTLSEAARTLAL
ncbi:MAG TPA: polysaccharide deacetylase family protein [Polyangiaceae bacterium]|jgi:peptidoglycan/xylan/chitin deacetylase (PgdA/CDA1 family)|nr:polysaccharide deacetylase family protein [Polyangiaceae bacterium]